MGPDLAHHRCRHARAAQPGVSDARPRRLHRSGLALRRTPGRSTTPAPHGRSSSERSPSVILLSYRHQTTESVGVLVNETEAIDVNSTIEPDRMGLGLSP